MRYFTWSKLLLLSFLSTSQLKAQSLSDGPYVEWLPSGDARVEAVCNSKHIATTLKGPDPILLEDPCTGEALGTIGGSMVSPPDSFTGVERFFAVSDVEGHFDEITTLLQNQGILNAKNEWIWGNGHLVFLGDMVDRGEYVTEVLWLIHRLEQEALKAGGRVHFLLGNHEKMTLEGDKRYLHKKYESVTTLLDRPYEDLFAANTEFGRWFRSRNVMLKLNDTLFVHAGLSPEFADIGLNLRGVNNSVRLGLSDAQVEKTDSKVKWLLSSKGPLWYRGYFKDEALKSEDIRSVFEMFGASRVAVGHTIVSEIEAIHDGLVLAVDTSFSKADKVQGLLYENGLFYRAGIRGSKKLLPIPASRQRR